jgi:hypothetical protein
MREIKIPAILYIMMQIFIFALTAVGILAISHVFLYVSFLKFFTIESVNFQHFIASALVFFPLGLIGIQILAHYYDTAFSRGLFYFFSLWFGVLTALVIFFLFAWILVGIGSVFHISISGFWVGVLVTIFTINYCASGIWNAYHPVIKNITVTVKNLPAEWKGKQVVQISDVHLGFIWGEKFFEKLIADVNALKPEAVFITGDLFDGTGDKFDYVASDLKKLNAPSGTYFVTGNHETYFGTEKSYELLKNSGVTVLKDEMKKVGGLQIVGVSYGERMANKNVAEVIGNISGYVPSGASILLYHEPSQIQEIKATGIKLQLSGHTHAGQIFPYRFITSLVYPGVDYGLHTFGDYTIYTTSGAGTWGPAMRVKTNSEIVVITLE